MITLENTTKSPQQLTTKSGKAVIVGAYKKVTEDFCPEYLKLLLSFGSFRVVVDAPEQQQDDKETEAKETLGGEDKEQQGAPEELNRDELKEEYKALSGEEPTSKWNTERLAREVAKLKAE